jgi:hypothetical protein
VVLPVFVTGRKPEPRPPRHAAPDDRLPPSERGMLLFVAALLGLGTVAVVAMIGLTGGTTVGRPPVHRSPVPTVASVPQAPPPATLPSPTPPSPVPSPPARTTPAARRTTPARVALGTLSRDDLNAYCMVNGSGFAHPPDNASGQWTCGRRGQAFTPNDACRWRFNDHTAYAVVGDIMDPTTWRCYT